MDRHWVVLRYVMGENAGRYTIFKDYDDGHRWGSPMYEVVAYAGTYKEALQIKRDDPKINPLFKQPGETP
tara:strand:- start:159 stop:368 length:210 start_codon:yes stop_codon:yes gene_type:complete